MPKTYSEKLKDPRWQKKRLQILERDGWACLSCLSEEKTLHVHHKTYSQNTEPWDYKDENFLTLCEGCHKAEKSERKESESLLISALLTNPLTASDIHAIACDFAYMKQGHVKDVVVATLGKFLRDEPFQRRVVALYLKTIRAKYKK